MISKRHPHRIIIAYAEMVAGNDPAAFYRREIFNAADFFYDELFICPLEETDIFSVDESGRGIRVSFGICRADGEILYSVQDILIPMLNE